MEPFLLDRRSRNNRSFLVGRHKFPSFLRVWHYHQEIELVLVLKSTGQRFVGDSIEKFEPGQLVLLGENLPHMWLNDELYFQDESELQADAIAIHFRMDFLGKAFFNTPELAEIKDLIEKAQRGILFLDLDETLKNRLSNLTNLIGVEQLLELMAILNELVEWENSRYLATEGYIKTFDQTESKRLKEVYAYVFENYQQPISLKRVSEIAHMNPSAFSRFFKKVHRKTFVRYLNEIRIGRACRLLIAGKQSIKNIGYDCGFNNVSNFNRQFKLIRGMTPSQFVKYHEK